MTTITRLLLVPVATQSPTVMTFSSKTPASRLDYTLDLQNRLPTLASGAFDTITGFTATSSSPADLTVSTNGMSGTTVGVIISGGLLNIIYQIHFVITTAAGFIIALDIYQSVEPEGLASTTPPVGVVAGPQGIQGVTGPTGPVGSSTGLQVASNLSDVANAATARGNLGLGTMATQNASAVSLTGTLSMAPTGGFSVIDAGTGTLLLKSGSTGSNGLIQAFATLTAPKLTTTGNVVFAGVASATQNGVQFKSTLSGALTAGQQGYLALSLINDTVAAAPTGTSLSGISVAHTTASGATGNRWMADLTTTSGAASTQLALGGIRTTVLSGFNQGGTDLVSNSLGNLFGANFVAQALPGATFLNGVAGQEIDVQVQSGASTQAKVGLAIVLLSSDAVQGNSDDYALNFNNQYLPVSGTGWKNLIGVGRWGGSSPLDPVNGWILSCMAHLNVGTVAGAGGLDFNNFTPTTAFMRGNGFLLDPAGNWTCNNLTGTGNATVGGTLGVTGVTTHNALLHMAQPASIQFDGSRTWSGTQSAIGNAEIYSFTNQSGTTTSGSSVAFHYFGVASDTLQSTNPVGNLRSELTTGTGITGGRNSIWGSINIGGTPGTNGQYVAGTFAAVATAPANAGGNILYGTNPTAGLNAAATGAWSVVGEEIDVRAVTGSTPVSLTGLSIVTVSGHNVHGSGNIDTAIAIGNQSGTSTGWDYVLRIGGPSNIMPVVSTATLIATWSGIAGLSCANGVDFSSMAFSGFSVKMPGFTVDGSGNTTALSYKVGANQVIGARDTGWSALTGTTNKATVYDTASVTLAQLAGRIMALQAALTTHGVIGA